MRVLDLYCGAGMAADGYAAAGFEVVGVDLVDQPDYPYTFIRADAMSFPLEGFDLVHASPPCQPFSRGRTLRDAQGHAVSAADLLVPTLDRLVANGAPFVVENVEDVPFAYDDRYEQTVLFPDLPEPDPGRSWVAAVLYGAKVVRLCGSAFGLDVQRHRLFASNVPLRGTACHHERFPVDPVTGKPRPFGVYHKPGDNIPRGGRTAVDADHARRLFGMTRRLPWLSVKEGFPPAYTAYLGTQVATYLGSGLREAVG